MKAHSLLLLLVSAAFLLPSSARADVQFHPAFMYLQGGSGPSGTEDSNSRLLFDLGAQWVSEKGWMAGAMYAIERASTQTGGTSSWTANRTSMGPSVGWTTTRDVGLFALATYYFQTEYGNGGNPYKGTGYQVDLGLRFAIKRFFLAPQFSYKKFEYKQYGGETITPFSHTYLDPYFGIIFQF